MITDSPLAWAIFAVVFVTILLGCAWQAIAPRATFFEFLREFGERRIAFLVKLWRFWGPRATDKNALGILFANVALLNIVDPSTLNTVQLAIWVGANVLFTPYENLPFETLEGPRPQPTIEISGPVQVKAQ